MRRMFRYEVPADDRDHVVLSGEPVAVAAASVDMVEFWAEHGNGREVAHLYRVFGTGHEIPDRYQHVGSCQRLHGLVWHLYRCAP